MSPPIPMADGSVKYHWKPTRRLRALGFTNVDLGTDYAGAVAAAVQLNEQVAGFDAGKGRGVAAPARSRYHSAGELIAHFRASESFADLAPATRKLYNIYLTRIGTWLEDGRTMIENIEPPMVEDLRSALTRAGKPHTTANFLRILRLLMRYGVRIGWMKHNPTENIAIKTPPTGTKILSYAGMMYLAATARDMQWPNLALGLELDFWIVQRRSDLVAMPQTAWRKFDNVDPADAAVLANRAGDVMGFRLRQMKTGAWVDCPVPLHLHDRIERGLKDRPFILMDDTADKRYSGDLFTARFRKLTDRALQTASAANDMAMVSDLSGLKFRDFRRSGMCWHGDMGTPIHHITALSGHAVTGQKTILDTYMPGHTRAAAAAIANAVKHMARQEQREIEG
jgi:hypothetical protein